MELAPLGDGFKRCEWLACGQFWPVCGAVLDSADVDVAGGGRNGLVLRSQARLRPKLLLDIGNVHGVLICHEMFVREKMEHGDPVIVSA